MFTLTVSKALKTTLDLPIEQNETLNLIICAIISNFVLNNTGIEQVLRMTINLDLTGKSNENDVYYKSFANPP